MSPPALLTKLKVGIGKILLGNIFRILKSRYPSVSRFSSKFLGKYDTSITHIKRKYRTIERVTPVNFLEQHLDSGDILLRHSPSIVGIGTQLVDNSWWDHISMVVVQRGERPSSIPTAPLPPWAPEGFQWEPFHDGQLQLFEANQVGCYAYPFGQFVRLFKRKHQLVLARRLQGVNDNDLQNNKHYSASVDLDVQRANEYNMERQRLDDTQRDSLESFVREVQGRPYEKNIVSELLSLIITHPPDLEIVKNKSDENLESIFCSELVAEAFQRIHVIPNCVLNSNEVMPSAFSSGANVIDRLVLHESIPEYKRRVLGNEKLITWDDFEANFKNESWWF